MPRVFSLPQVCVPTGRALQGYTCFPQPGTQSSLCPVGLKVKVNVAPRGGGEALEPEGLPLTGSQVSTLSLFPRLVGQAGRRMGAVMWRHPSRRSWRHGSWSQSQWGPQSLGRPCTGHRGRGQPWSPDWRATAGRPGALAVCSCCPGEGDTHSHLPCPSSWGFGHSFRPPALMTPIGHLLRALGRRGPPQLCIQSRGGTSSSTSLDLLSLRGRLCHSHFTDEQTEARHRGTGPRPQRR